IEIGLNGGPSESGTFTITFRGETTDPIPFDATTDDIVVALEALSTIGVGNVQGSSSNGGGSLADETYFDIEFIGSFAAVDVELPTYDFSNLLPEDAGYSQVNVHGTPGDPMPADGDRYADLDTDRIYTFYDGSWHTPVDQPVDTAWQVVSGDNVDNGTTLGTVEQGVGSIPPLIGEIRW